MLPKTALSGVWKEDFNDGNADDWEIIVDEWEVKDGAFEALDQSKSYSRVIIGDETWTDYAVECDVTLVEPGALDCAGLLVRCDNEGKNAYRFWIRKDTNVFEVYKWENGNWANPNYLTVNFPIDYKETYRLRVEVEGYDFKCYIDGKEVGEFEDGSKFRESGKIGLIVCNANAAFDNIIIEGDQIVGQAVQAAGKLAITWGSLKAK